MPTIEPGALNSLHMLRDEKHLVNMFSDENAPISYQGYTKHTHKYGVTARAQFKAEGGHDFTGLFADDVIGIIRLSRIKLNGSAHQFDPNVAFHAFVDKHSSIPLLVMPSVDGQASNHNFFANPMSTMPGPAYLAPANLIDDRFANVANSVAPQPTARLVDGRLALRLSLEEHASYPPSGAAIPRVHAPYEIIFEAPPEIVAAYEEALATTWSEEDFRLTIAKLFKEGDVIFDVYVREEREALDAWSFHWTADRARHFYESGKMQKLTNKKKNRSHSS